MLQNFNHHNRCEQIHHAPGVDERSGGEALQYTALPGAYGQSCGHEDPKSRKILQKMAEGTLPNVVFTDEKKFDIQQVVHQKNDWVWHFSSSTEGRIDTRYQNPQSVMVWAAVTETGRSPLLFVPSVIELKFWRVACCQEALPRSSLLPVIGLCALSRFQDYPVLDSEENPLIHKQGRLACRDS